MKVLQEGSPKSWEIHRTCYNCHSKLLVAEEDVKVSADNEPGFATEYSFYFICPVCKTANDIAESRIPEGIASMVKYRYYCPKSD